MTITRVRWSLGMDLLYCYSGKASEVNAYDIKEQVDALLGSA